MHQNTVKVLEFEKIRSELLEYCISLDGREAVRNEGFFYTQENLEPLHLKVEQAREYMEREEFPSFEFPELSGEVHELQKEGIVLEGEEIVRFARYFNSAHRLSAYLRHAGEYGYEAIAVYADQIGDFRTTAKEIFSILNPDGSVKDSHPELKKQRAQLARLRNELNQAAKNYLQQNSDRWQSDVPTQRDGRIVLPLKAQYQNMVSGVIHYSSARGATVYIEPPELMTKNNDIALVEQEIREIILSILRDLTGTLSERYTEISQLLEVVAKVDSFLCRARYARIHNCIRPLYRERGFKLKKARHPLLRDAAVPIDIETAPDVKSLIISGPNAGGKTVTLKTVGLLSLMNQFGLQIPAEEGTELAICNGIYADIGDEQSIEGSLSTFSGHMTKIAEMLEHADTHALALLDELGSGTDPGEGATLAMAVLDEFLSRGATTLATSHHGLLKNYGYTTPHVQNASMDFDASTLTPNYKVVVGLPGESHALDIASRSGMPEGVIEKARNYLSHESGEVSRMIKELEQRQADFKQREEALKQREASLKEQIKKHDLSELRLRQHEHELKQSGYGELNKFLHEARQELENLVSKLKSSAASGESLTKDDTKQVKEFIKKIEDREEREKQKVEKEEAKFAASDTHDFSPGMEVMTGPGRRRGTILRQAKKGHWLVEVGAMKITLPEKELTPVHQKIKNYDQKPSYGYTTETSNEPAVFTLDVRGERLDEALDKVNRQIDNAIIANLNEFEIIHGKGEGVLQNGIQRLLGESPRVEDFYFSRPEHGGMGKTIVKLKH